MKSDHKFSGTMKLRFHRGMINTLCKLCRKDISIDLESIISKEEDRLNFPWKDRFNDLHYKGLSILVDAISKDRSIDNFGRKVTQEQITRWVQNFLFVERDIVENPNVLRTPVTCPVLVAGIPRSGTTYLHNILALDPAARAPRLWEIFYPSPPPQKDTYRCDERIGAMKSMLNRLRSYVPDLFYIHSMAAEDPDECHNMMMHGTHHFVGYQAEEYWRWLKGLNHDELHFLYSRYKRQIQHLTSRHSGSHWLSKSGVHLFFSPVLHDVFPDARIVRMHRDPAETIPSVSSLAAAYRCLINKIPDADGIGSIMLETMSESMKRMAENDTNLSEKNVIDIFYSDLVSDPVLVVKRIYKKFSMNYSEEFEYNIREFLQRDKKSYKKKHTYSAEMFGLSISEIHKAANDYLLWASAKRSEG